MANIKDILNYGKEAAIANGYSYRIVRSLSDVNAITANQFPLICILPPSSEAAYLDKATHSLTVFVLDKVKKVKQDTTKNTNDRYHAEYKALDDAFYAWHTSMVNSNNGESIFTPVGEDISISRLWDGRTNEELIGSQYEVDFVTTWYCNGSNPDIPSGGGGSCDPATVLNADGSSYLTVASGGSVQLTGVTIAGQTPNTGVQNDGTTFTVSGVTIAGQTPNTGVQQDGSTFTVTGVTVSGNTPATGVQQDGSTFSVSGVTVTGNTSATGVKQDGSTFNVSGVTVNDGGSTTYDDGTTVNIFRNNYSVLLNGTTQYLDQTTTDMNFGYADDFSVEFWVRNDALTFATYVGNYDTSPSNGWRINRGGTGANRGGIDFQIAAGGSIDYRIITNSTSLLTAGLWHHVVVCKPANNVAANACIYVDGVSVPFTVNNTGGVATPTFLDKLTIGANSDLAGNLLDARFDSCVIYNRELSAAEVTDHYNNGRPDDRSNDSGALRYFRFENDLTDTLGNQDLTGYNSPTFSNQRP